MNDSSLSCCYTTYTSCLLVDSFISKFQNFVVSNRYFNFDIFIFHDGFSDEKKKLIKNIYYNVIFKKIEPEDYSQEVSNILYYNRKIQLKLSDELSFQSYSIIKDKTLEVIVYRTNNIKEKRVNDCLDATINGLRALDFTNVRVVIDGKYTPSDIAVIFGGYSKHHHQNTLYRKIVKEEQFKRGKHVLVLEQGFLNRSKYYSIGFNHHIGYGKYNSINEPCDRLDSLGITFNEWKTDGHDIVLCSQLPWDTSIQHLNKNNIFESIIKDIKKHTKNKIIYREHPLLNSRALPLLPHNTPGVEFSKKKTLREDLANAKCMICINSTSAIESVILGIPIFTLDRGSLLHKFSNQDINNINAPSVFERRQIFNDIAYTQWSTQEIASGTPFKRLLTSTNIYANIR